MLPATWCRPPRAPALRATPGGAAAEVPSHRFQRWVPAGVRAASVAVLVGGIFGDGLDAYAEAPGQSPTPTGADVDLSPLADGHSERTNFRPAGSEDDYGRARILVHAPIGIVHRLILDYGRYKEFTGGRFRVSRVVGRTALGTEVYFQLSILRGAIMLWQVFRFQDLKPLAPGWAMVEGWYVKGNIGRGNAAWTLHAVDNERTLLTFDLLVVPNIPLPRSMLDRGLQMAAGAAVEAIRDRAEEQERGGN